MKRMMLGKSTLEVSEIALGCLKLGRIPYEQAEALVEAALEAGITFFDHADVYSAGLSEEAFGRILAARPGLRERIQIQTKCGIRSGYFDFSKDHILEAVDGSLKRLGVDYIDVLLLHRPDALVEPDEVAEAFDALERAGKVRHFGVSNLNPMQMKLLKKSVRQPFVANQLQFSVTNTGMVDAGFNVNMQIDRSIDRDGSILDYCRLHDITVQAWSPFQFGFFQGTYLDNPAFGALNREIDELVQEYGVPNTAIALAWILRHPAGIQPIAGTTNPERLRGLCKASGITLTRAQWYTLYKAAGNTLP